MEGQSLLWSSDHHRRDEGVGPATTCRGLLLLKQLAHDLTQLQVRANNSEPTLVDSRQGVRGEEERYERRMFRKKGACTHLISLSCCSLRIFSSGNVLSNSSLFFKSLALKKRERETRETRGRASCGFCQWQTESVTFSWSCSQSCPVSSSTPPGSHRTSDTAASPARGERCVSQGRGLGWQEREGNVNNLLVSFPLLSPDRSEDFYM